MDEMKMSCATCRRWARGWCLAQQLGMSGEQVCNAWELSQVVEWEDENENLHARIAELELFVAKLVEAGCALEMESYDAWRKDGMLDFPAAEVWHTLAQDWKEREG